MATLNVIRRWALRDQMSVREISRRTGLARNTVKKHLRSEESEPRYPRRVSSSKLDPYAEKLATWLGIEATKSRKQRRTLRQIHTDATQKGENQELIHIVSTFCSQECGSIFDGKLGSDFREIQHCLRLYLRGIARSVPVIRQSRSLQDCGVCQHPFLLPRRCDRPATATAPHAAAGSAPRSARACV